MKVELKTPTPPPEEIVVTLTRREAKVIREALYMAYWFREDTRYISDSITMSEVVAIGNELYNLLTL